MVWCRAMTIAPDFLAALAFAAEKFPGSRTLPWPAPKQLGGFVTFADFAEWQQIILGFSLSDGLPLNMVDLFDRALKLYLAAWLDFDLVTAAEMAALAALEHSLRACYLGDFRERHNKKAVAKAKSEKRELKLEENFRPERISLATLLRHMHERDGLTDDQLPCVRKYGGSVTTLLTGEADRASPTCGTSGCTAIRSAAAIGPACLSWCMTSSNTPTAIGSTRSSAALRARGKPDYHALIWGGLG